MAIRMSRLLIIIFNFEISLNYFSNLAGVSALYLSLHADLLLPDGDDRGLLREAGPPEASARGLRFHRTARYGGFELHQATLLKRDGGIRLEGKPGSTHRRLPIRDSNDWYKNNKSKPPVPRESCGDLSSSASHTTCNTISSTCVCRVINRRHLQSFLIQSIKLLHRSPVISKSSYVIANPMRPGFFLAANQAWTTAFPTSTY